MIERANVSMQLSLQQLDPPELSERVPEWQRAHHREGAQRFLQVTRRRADSNGEEDAEAVALRADEWHGKYGV